ncbi:MAG: endonuclease III [Ignavibacteriales bacterium]|nr:endonuclease III [Ignavibacteriales bacterium]
MKKETLSKKIKRTQAIEKALHKAFPNPQIALYYENPLQLLISVILSAQCTDVRVNMVTPALFKKYRTAKDFAEAGQSELEIDIHSTGFYRNKAKNIIACCRSLVEQHGGEVPATMEELQALAGVGRKTANCVLGGAFGIPSGIVVDTHVKRIAARLALTDESDPEKVEADLTKLLDKKDWIHFSNALILHGRKTCDARKPLCNECPLASLCPSAVMTTTKRKNA